MKETDQQLSDVLGEWRLDPIRDPQFRLRVRERLGKTVSDPWMHYLRAHLVPCAAAASLALVAGAWAGHLQAERQMKKDREVMAAAYLASLDARYQVALQDRQ